MVLILALLACTPRHEPFPAGVPLSVEVVPVLTSDRGVADAPDSLDRQVMGALQARNLLPRLVPPDRYLEAFRVRRDTSRRLEAVRGDDLLLLVEAEPRYFANVEGRFRWVVDVRLTLAPDGMEARFEVPVFLTDPHQGEQDALAAAGPAIARQAGALVDRWLGGR